MKETWQRNMKSIRQLPNATLCNLPLISNWLRNRSQIKLKGKKKAEVIPCLLSEHQEIQVVINRKGNYETSERWDNERSKLWDSAKTIL